MGRLEEAITAGFCEPVNVGIGSDWHPWQLPHLLRSAVIKRSCDAAAGYGLTSLRSAGTRLDHTLLERQAEVNQFHLPPTRVLAHQQVGRFHVPVPDALAVCGLESLSHLPGHDHEGFRRQWT